jgi:hypothetical protein
MPFLQRVLLAQQERYSLNTVHGKADNPSTDFFSFAAQVKE